MAQMNIALHGIKGHLFGKWSRFGKDEQIQPSRLASDLFTKGEDQVCFGLHTGAD